MKPIFGGYKLQFGIINNIKLHNVKIENCQCIGKLKKVKALVMILMNKDNLKMQIK